MNDTPKDKELNEINTIDNIQSNENGKKREIDLANYEGNNTIINKTISNGEIELGDENNKKYSNLDESNNDSQYTYLEEPLIFKDYKKKGHSNKYYEYELTGFTNIGHNCYMNSFLQILLHFPNFLIELKNYVQKKGLNIKLIDNLINLSENPSNTKYLSNIKKLMGKVDQRYGQYIQNDSQLFGIDLINQIILSLKEEETPSNGIELKKNYEEKDKININNIKEYKKKYFNQYKDEYHYQEEKELFLEKMFQLHESIVKIKTKDLEIGKIEKIDFETFLNIQIVFPESHYNYHYNYYHLIDLLKYKYINWFEPDNKDKNTSDNLNEKDSFKDKNDNIINENDTSQNNQESYWIRFIELIKAFFCKFKFFGYSINGNKNLDYSNNENKKIIKKRKFIKVRRLASLPKILIISINRAILGRDFNDDSLKYDEYLDVNQFIDKDILNDKKSNIYKLFAINECLGHTRFSGHCYSYIKIKDEWYKFNDDYVSRQTPEFSSNYVVGLYYIQNEDNK